MEVPEPQSPDAIHDAVLLATGDDQLARQSQTRAQIEQARKRIEWEQMMKNAGR